MERQNSQTCDGYATWVLLLILVLCVCVFLEILRIDNIGAKMNVNSKRVGHNNNKKSKKNYGEEILKNCV